MWIINTIWILLLIVTVVWTVIMFFEEFSIIDAILEIWDTHIIGPTVLISTGVLTVMSIFGIKYILTTKAFWLTIMGIAGLALLTFLTILIAKGVKKLSRKMAIRKAERRHRSKENKYSQALNTKMPEGSICDENEAIVDELMEEYGKLTSAYQTQETKTLAYNVKMLVIHATCVRGELNDNKIYQTLFGDIIKEGVAGRFDKLRDITPQRKIDSSILAQINQLHGVLENNTMDQYIDRLERASQMDTSGFFFDHNKYKVIEQTELMVKALNAAKFEYAELRETAKKINSSLKILRIYAFRNIKLAIDLMEYGRPNVGGNTLETAKDSVDILVEVPEGNFEAADLSIDGIGLLGDTIEVFSNSLEEISSFKNSSKLTKGDIGLAAGIAAIEAVGQLIAARNQAIENNLEVQKAILEQFPVVVDSYNKIQAELYRAIELMKAIIKVNDALYRVYTPLKNKVFGAEYQKLEMSELNALVKATNAYNKITGSTL